jgi:hypothetical protein
VALNSLDSDTSEFIGQTALFRHDLNKSLPSVMQVSGPAILRRLEVKSRTWARSQEAEM